MDLCSVLYQCRGTGFRSKSKKAVNLRKHAYGISSSSDTGACRGYAGDGRSMTNDFTLHTWISVTGIARAHTTLKPAAKKSAVKLVSLKRALSQFSRTHLEEASASLHVLGLSAFL